MLKSLLKPESSVTTGVLEAIGIYLIYNHSLPGLHDVKSAPQHDDTLESTRRTAGIESAVLLGAVFALTRDFNALIIGGVSLLAVDSMYKHANAVNPGTGKADMSGGRQSISPTLATSYALPDYSDDAAA